MSSTQRSRKHGTNKGPVVDSTIINHKRGEASNITKRLKLLEGLQTKTTEVTCCDFGPDRELSFPDHFFCHQCKDRENRNQENRKLNCGMKKYQCRAKHKDYITPNIPNKKTSVHHLISIQTK